MERRAARLVISRRAFLAAALATACSRKRGPRYQGWLFVSSGSEKSIAVANLSSFRRMTSVALPCAANQLFKAGRHVFALCRDARAIASIDLGNQQFAGKFDLPASPIAVRVLPGQKEALVLAGSPGMLLHVNLDTRRVISRARLPAEPADFDLNERLAAVTLPSASSILRVDIDRWTVNRSDVGAACNAVRFRRDGRSILAAATSAHQIVTIDAQSGKLLTRLSLPIAPARFCFNGDGGQMFVTGDGQDALAIVSPFQNEVDQTILAGRTPAAMAVSDKLNLLFVTNRDSGDLTILDIETRSLSASVHVGENPSEVLLTPDNEYALIVDQRSGNVSVVRISTVLDRKIKTKPLFTVFPTAADAQSALIVPFEA